MAFLNLIISFLILSITCLESVKFSIRSPTPELIKVHRDAESITIQQARSKAFIRLTTRAGQITGVQRSPSDNVLLLSYQRDDSIEEEAFVKGGIWYLVLLPAWPTSADVEMFLEESEFDDTNQENFYDWIDQRNDMDDYTVVAVYAWEGAFKETWKNTTSLAFPIALPNINEGVILLDDEQDKDIQK